jgi:hypothetical protein
MAPGDGATEEATARPASPATVAAESGFVPPRDVYEYLAQHSALLRAFSADRQDLDETRRRLAELQAWAVARRALDDDFFWYCSREACARDGTPQEDENDIGHPDGDGNRDGDSDGDGDGDSDSDSNSDSDMNGDSNGGGDGEGDRDREGAGDQVYEPRGGEAVTVNSPLAPLAPLAPLPAPLPALRMDFRTFPVAPQMNLRGFPLASGPARRPAALAVARMDFRAL